MVRIALALCIFSLAFSNVKAQQSDPLKKAKGGKFYGGVFKINESDYFSTLFPPSSVDFISKRIISYMYEGLLSFDDKDLSLKPGLAESFAISDGQKTYTFKIKKNVFFHRSDCFPQGKGRELTAEDVRKCLQFLCSSHVLNNNFHLFKDLIKGGNAFYNGTSVLVEGIKIIDPYTVQIELVRPSPIFLYLLADPSASVYPEEFLVKHQMDVHSKAVGSGPFFLEKLDEGNSMLLGKNEQYNRSDEYGNKLPYLSGLKIRFLKDKKQELLEFKKGNLDMMYRIPTDHIIEIIEEVISRKGQYGKYDLQRNPEFLTQTLCVSMKSSPTKNLAFRKAISFAINRNYILEAVLNGEGFGPAVYGITPPSFGMDYDIRKIKGYDMNLDSARYYLKKSGHPTQRELRLVIFSEGERNVAVAEEIQKQLREALNINILIEVMPLSQLILNASQGKPAIYLIPVKADYADPQSFLQHFYGKNIPQDSTRNSYINISHYVNPLFDRYYEKAISASSKEEANKNFMLAEKVLMRDAGSVTLWYDEGYRIVQPNVNNFPNNALQYRDFSEVYFSE